MQHLVMSPMFNILRVTCTNQNFVNMPKNEEDRTKDSFPVANNVHGSTLFKDICSR
jgi:hypothetical protein